MGLKSLVSIMATCKNVRIISSVLPTLLFFFLLLELSTAQAAIPQSEREALISLYNATNGDDWTNSDGWTGAPGTECDWHGVYCRGDVVFHLRLGNNNLVGTLPEEIGNLTQLTSLYAYDNSLSGTIPEEIGNLTQLTALRLFNNSLSGTIPEEIGNLTQLTSLLLSANSLSGTIPNTLGNLLNLKMLALDYNLLSGAIPDWLGNLLQLDYLNLKNNSFTGVIPSSLGNLSLLKTLYLNSKERYSGALPNSLRQLENLTSDDLPNLKFFPLDNDNDGIPDEYDNDSAIKAAYKRIQTTDYAIIFSDNNVIVNLVHPSLYASLVNGSSRQSDQAIANIIYDNFEDQFDFLIVAPVCNGCLGTNYHRPIKPRATGLGLNQSSDDISSTYGSQGGLYSFVYLTSTSMLKNGPGTHEMMHAWAAPSMFNSGNKGHNGYSNLGGILGGWKPGTLRELGQDRYSIETMISSNTTIAPNGWSAPIMPYGNFELYLAGLIGPDEVGHDIKLATGFTWVDEANRTFSAASIQTTTMDDFIELNGPRQPSHLTSQKDFQAMQVVISSEPLTKEEFNDFSSDVYWFQSPKADDNDSRYNFWESTKGKARMFFNQSDHALSTTYNYRLENTGPTIDLRSIEKIIKDFDGVSGEKVTLTPILTDDYGIASVNWLIDGKIIATGSAPQINLSDGTTNLTVEVTDTDFDMTSATLAIEVLAPFTVDTGWSATFNGVIPDPSLGLPFNNIGTYDFSKKILSSCLRLLKDGEIFNYNGINSLEVNFAVVSDELGILKLANSRGFNPLNLVNERGDPPACSGTFETTSNVYTDVVKSTFIHPMLRDMEVKIVNIFEMKFRLFDGENLLFRLESFTQLD